MVEISVKWASPLNAVNVTPADLDQPALWTHVVTKVGIFCRPNLSGRFSAWDRSAAVVIVTRIGNKPAGLVVHVQGLPDAGIHAKDFPADCMLEIAAPRTAADAVVCNAIREAGINLSFMLNAEQARP